MNVVDIIGQQSSPSVSWQVNIVKLKEHMLAVGLDEQWFCQLQWSCHLLLSTSSTVLATPFIL